MADVIIQDGSVKWKVRDIRREELATQEKDGWMSKEDKKKLDDIDSVSCQIPRQNGTLVYTGSTLYPVWSGYDATKVQITGTQSAINVGTYTAVFTLTDSYYTWTDGTTGSKEVEWSISRMALNTPSQNGTLVYNGSIQTPIWNNYDSAALTIMGVTSASDIGTYNAIFTPNANYQWADGSTVSKTVTWLITANVADVPVQNGSLTYNGMVQSPVWSGYDSNKMIIAGTSQASKAGTYNVTFTPTNNYKWADGTTSAKSATWSIQKAVINSIPTQSGLLVYTGETQSPTFNDYETSKMDIGGTTSAIEIGIYTANFTPNSNYTWSDGSSTTKLVTWQIAESTNKAETDKSMALLDYRMSQAEINISNLYIKLNAANELGVAANLMLIEDFQENKYIDLYETKVTSAVQGVANIQLESDNDILIGSWYWISDSIRCEHVQVNSVIRNGSVYMVVLNKALENSYVLDKTTFRRSTALVSGNVCYGAGDIKGFQYNPTLAFKGIYANKETTVPLETTQKNRDSFNMTGDGAFDINGFFTLSS